MAIAGDVRIAWQTSKLLDLEARIKRRLGELEARKAQFAEWLRKHDEAKNKAGDGLIAIYAHMKPDAAALQLAAMDDAMAATITGKLSPRVASTILNEEAVAALATLIGNSPGEPQGPAAAQPNEHGAAPAGEPGASASASALIDLAQQKLLQTDEVLERKAP